MLTSIKFMIKESHLALKNMTKRIGVIGAGISGLSAAHLLSQKGHLVDIFEKESKLGGHTDTHTLDLHGSTVNVDSGFIVFNNRNYKNLINFFEELNIKINKSDMSFSYSSESYSWSSKDFFNIINYLSIRQLSLLKNIINFKRVAIKEIESNSELTLGEWLDQIKFPKEFERTYILPMGAAIWSTDTKKIKDFPLMSYLKFFQNHGLFDLINRPQWFSVHNGSNEYIKVLLRKWSVNKVHLKSNVLISKKDNRFLLTNNDGQHEYDYLIFACHANQINECIDFEWKYSTLFKSISYVQNTVFLHIDPSYMPHDKKMWASWNTCQNRHSFGLTYWMNNLQKLNTDQDIFVSLGDIKPRADMVLKEMNYQHPLYNQALNNAVKEIKLIQGNDNIFFVGAYHGNGFHEDGLKSAKGVVRMIQRSENDC